MVLKHTVSCSRRGGVTCRSGVRCFFARGSWDSSKNPAASFWCSLPLLEPKFQKRTPRMILLVQGVVRFSLEEPQEKNPKRKTAQKRNTEQCFFVLQEQEEPWLFARRTPETFFLGLNFNIL